VYGTTKVRISVVRTGAVLAHNKSPLQAFNFNNWIFLAVTSYGLVASRTCQHFGDTCCLSPQHKRKVPYHSILWKLHTSNS